VCSLAINTRSVPAHFDCSLFRNSKESNVDSDGAGVRSRKLAIAHCTSEVEVTIIAQRGAVWRPTGIKVEPLCSHGPMLCRRYAALMLHEIAERHMCPEEEHCGTRLGVFGKSIQTCNARLQSVDDVH
jgi:hypothetical protein